MKAIYLKEMRSYFTHWQPIFILLFLLLQQEFIFQ